MSVQFGSGVSLCTRL